MKVSQIKRGAFTLIELLVVITIIAILAGIALPVYNNVTEKGQQTKALSNAKQVGLACKLFAGDNDGNFPQEYTLTGTEYVPNFGAAPADSNRAFRQLVPNYVASENIFYVAKSAWTPNTPDENTTGEAQALKGGENHWAYVPRLNDTSNPNFPLIADGFTTGGAATGTYTGNQTLPGGVWSGKRAIVVKADQSGSIEKLNASFQLIGRTGAATKENIFAKASNGGNWIPADAVNPTPGSTPGSGATTP